MASDGVTNLSAADKAAALVARYGAGGFDYAGNSAHDFPCGLPPGGRLW